MNAIYGESIYGIATHSLRQIRSTSGAHSDPVCTLGLVIAEDPSAAQSGGPWCMLSPVDRPCWVTTGGLRRDLGLIVPRLASRPRITVYWDGMPR
jgi:hypothetical protein